MYILGLKGHSREEKEEEDEKQDIEQKGWGIAEISERSYSLLLSYWIVWSLS